MVETSTPYAAPEVPSEKGYDQTDVPSESANEAPTAVPSEDDAAQRTDVDDEENRDE